MEFVSTRNDGLKVSASRAIVEGLSREGGLFTPTAFPHIEVKDLLDKSYQEMAFEVLSALFSEFDKEELRNSINKAYGLFDCDEVVPLSDIGDKHLLELYHGPTSAFKDVALTLLPYLLNMSYKNIACDKKIYILTATSGDTGKAALEGFKDVENTYITVFYPEDGVSQIQRKQMISTTGKNTHVVAIKGNFDDCQKLVKQAYGLDGFRDDYPKVQLSSANSINIGRLAPQIVYYFSSYVNLVNKGKINIGEEVSFVVPTGNFGDILAGYMAKKMGLPVKDLICASNDNDVLTEFINTGVYNRNREFHLTTSPSMDILVSSNLERLLYLVSEDSDLVAKYMNDLNEKGFYQVDGELLSRIQNDFKAYSIKSDEVNELIREAFEKDGRLIDPHTAVAYGAAKKYGLKVPTVILSTASPYKFSSNVYKCFKDEMLSDEYEAMAKLNELSGMRIPKNLSCLKEMEVRHKNVIEIKDGLKTIEDKLKELSHD